MQDGTNHGLHPFLVQIRDLNTLQPLPGAKVGDFGEKIGLNGVDNGFVQFTNYILPRENLLNKMGDVTEDGKYVTPFKDPSKRFGKVFHVVKFKEFLFSLRNKIRKWNIFSNFVILYFRRIFRGSFDWSSQYNCDLQCVSYRSGSYCY